MRLFIVILIVHATGWSQTNQFFQVVPSIGAVVPEYSNATLTTTSLNKSIGFSWYRRTNGNQNDEQLFHCPDGGLLFQVQTLGNQKVNGTEFSLVPFTRLHLLKERRWNLLWQVGIGLSGVTKKYDALTNPENVAIGSHLNIHFNTQFLVFYPTKRFDWTAGIAFDHLSNANLSEPNLGINSAYLNIGCAYRLNDQKVMEKMGSPTADPISRWSVLPAFGGKHTRALANQFYFVSSLSGEYVLVVKKRFSTAVGVDVFYDTSVSTEVEALGKNPADASLFSSGIHIAEQVNYKKWVFGVHLGVYAGLKEPINNKPLYSRGFIQYSVSDHFFVRLSMKSHLHILEFPEFGIGYKWHKK